MADHTIAAFTHGTHNLINPELIEPDAAQDSLGWLTKDGKIVLSYGRNIYGNDTATSGKICGLHFGYKTDGTQVLYRKISTKIQYLKNGTWTDIITGLTAGSDYSFSNYSSLSGAFTFVAGIDGIWKIVNAFPENPINMYLSTKNFKGKMLIDRGRSLLWGREQDKTGLYGSYIDRQNSTVYTSISGEVTGTSGILSFRGGTFTVTVASPGVFSKTAHGFIANDAVVFTTTGALPTGLTAGTTYYVISTGLTTDAFEVSATVGGSAINTSGTQSGVHTVKRTDTKNCFGVTITVTGTGEIFTDSYLGTLSGSLGHTGTINYVTGAYVLTTGGGAGTVAYQWEDSNAKGVTDFSKSATRLAGEGFQFPQDEGGDAILNVLIGQDGEYYSEKTHTFYKLVLEDTDLAATNNIYRKDLGIPSFRAGVSTNKGVVFMNTANPLKPEMTILQRSIVTSNVEPVILFPHFKFANYDYSDCSIDTWERYVIVLCKKQLSSSNDTILLCDKEAGTVDAVGYAGRCSVKDASGNLYVGSPLVENVYQLFNGFDDDGLAITNYWISKADQYQMATGFARAQRYSIGESLKKFRHEKVKGTISNGQKVEVYVDCDGSGFQLVGTIIGTGDYVDYSSPQSVGNNMVGQAQIGGDDTTVSAYPFFTELRTKIPKFRVRTIKLVATGIGYVDIQLLSDWMILVFEGRLPTRFRQKQAVSLDGAQTDL